MYVLQTNRLRDGKIKSHAVAYCGRVPVRVRGPARDGDVLISSGLHDGSSAPHAYPAMHTRPRCQAIAHIHEEVHALTRRIRVCPGSRVYVAPAARPARLALLCAQRA